MSSTLTTRLPDDLIAEIEQISEEEHLDKSAVARRFLEQAVTEHRREQAFARYEQGEISLERLAKQTDLPIRRVLAELRKRGIHFQYTQESLHEDVPDA